VGEVGKYLWEEGVGSRGRKEEVDLGEEERRRTRDSCGRRESGRGYLGGSGGMGSLGVRGVAVEGGRWWLGQL